MIVKHYDYGWGLEWPAKQLERSIIRDFLSPLANDSTRWAVVNSTWYSDQHHHDTIDDMNENSVQGIVLISMLDSAIPRPSWFSEFDVYGVGYYPGDNEIDFWALLMHKYFSINPSVDATDIDTAFLCLNRKPHVHRRRLYNQLEARGLLDKGLVSFGSDHGTALRLLPDDQGQSNLAPNGGIEQNGIPNDLVTLGNIKNWNRCFLDVVTETVFDIKQQHFVSEKIYKPILGMRPFLVYSSDGGVDWLEHRGFRTFVNAFSDITDLDLSDPNNVSGFLEVLAAQPIEYLRNKYLELLPRIRYNRENFDRYCQQQIDKVKRGIKTA